jgi:6-phosphogluconolactonase
MLEHAPLRDNQIHAMPVEASNLDQAAADYAKLLDQLSGSPPVIDLVHLGLGPDGHTASLVPGDSVLDVTDQDVALTGGLYQGRQRMTLTYPIINRARRILWLVTGADKTIPLKQLRDRAAAVPAGRVNQAHATVLADQAAAAQLLGYRNLGER